MPLSPGDKLGPYEILAAIGKGGMGEVYKAHDPRLQRDVAIKVSAMRFNERFEREARAVAALNHPNICQIYDVGPHYLVMELIEGPTLGEIIKEGPIALDEALRIAEQIAAALGDAHEKQITHRDLKPGNIKVKEDGVVKVLDFGLAKIGNTPTAEPLNSEDSPTLSMTLTQAGMILGTAAYMSPEQARGKPVDARADIWAFGVVLYEMLTAQRLFKGEDLGDTLASVVKEKPDLSAIPAKARRLIEACLQKDPRQRLQAIGDRHLLLVEPERVVVEAKPEPKHAGWLWPALAGMLAMGAATLGWAHFREPAPVVESLRYQLTREGRFNHFQLSPDGSKLAHVARGLHVRRLDALEDQDIPGTEGASYPFWSPDGTHIAFFAQGKLKQVALSGGPATTIADAPDARGGTWGADGTIVFAPTVSGGLSRVSPASGGPAVPLKLPVGDKDSLRFPAFLADSDRFFYVYSGVGPATSQVSGLYLGAVDGTPPVRLLADQSSARFVSAPGAAIGHVLFAREETLMAQPFDSAALKLTGEAFPLSGAVSYTGNIGNTAFTVSRNGTLLFETTGLDAQEREILWLDRTGTRGKTLVKQKGVSLFALSPDQSRVAFMAGSAQARDIWLYEIEHGTSQRFTFGPNAVQLPEWSPDSASVVFTARPNYELFRKPVQTSAKEETLNVVGVNATVSSWQSDGKLLVYSQTGDSTKDDIWLLPLEGDRKPKLFKQTPFAERAGQVSPDGRWMVYSSDASGQSEIYIEPMPSGGAQRQISLGGGASPGWRKDGRELYYRSASAKKLMVVDVKPGPDLTFGTPRELFSANLTIVDVRRRAVYPNADGSQFLAVLPVGDDQDTPPLTVVTNWLHAYGK